MGIIIFASLLSLALLRLGAALVWVHVLSSAMVASLAVIAVLGATMAWRQWRKGG